MNTSYNVRKNKINWWCISQSISHSRFPTRKSEEHWSVRAQGDAEVVYLPSICRIIQCLAWWWYKPVISALGQSKQEDNKFKANLSCIHDLVSKIRVRRREKGKKRKAMFKEQTHATFIWIINRFLFTVWTNAVYP